MGEAQERDLHPIPASETRARVMGGFTIRESLLRKFKKGIDAGLAFPDAAKAAGIPYEFVLAALTHDEDVRSWYRQAAGRKSLIRAEDAHLLPEVKSTIQIKRETVNLAMAAGLGHKFAEAIAHIRPVDENGEFNQEHMNVLHGFMKSFVAMLPKESDVTNKDAGEQGTVDELTEEQAMQKLVELREARLKREADERRAIEARSTGGRSLKGPEPDEIP